jgi:hypothetical protein
MFNGTLDGLFILPIETGSTMHNWFHITMVFGIRDARVANNFKLTFHKSMEGGTSFLLSPVLTSQLPNLLAGWGKAGFDWMRFRVVFR